MDFHSLKRRELQALCKKNKIPANITNIAMANALAALDIVEGMEEFLNPSSVESPEKTVKASPCVPRTGGRTSSRRKPINEEPDSVQILSRAPRVTRKAKIDVDETPAIHSNRKTVASSSSRKMETPKNQKEEISGQKMYSRRSTRLLEKKMVELNLNDAEGIKPIDFGGSDKEVPNEVEENVKEDSDDLGLNQESMSDDLMETDIEDLLDKKSGDLSENAREPEQTSEVLDETVNVLVSQENTVSLTPGMVEDVDDEVDDANKDDDGADSEGCAESDFLSGENLEKSLGLKDEIPEEGCDDSGYIDTTECLVSKNGEEGFTAEKDSGSDIMDLVDDPLSEDLGTIEFDALNLSVSAAAEDQKQDIELQNLATIELDDEANNENEDDDGSEGYAESDILLGETLEKSPDLKDDLVSDDLGVMDFDTTEYQKQAIELQNQATKEFDIISVNDLGSTLTGEDKSKEDEKETTLVTPNCGEEYDQLVIESGNEFESTTTESSNAVDCPTVTASHISSCSVISENNVSDSFTPQGITPLSRLTQLIDMALSTLAADPLPEQMSSNSDLVICPASVTPTKKSGNLMAENPSTLSLPSSDKTPGAGVPIDMASSTLAADPLPQQMSSSLLQLGSNSETVICPASVTPTMKSASKAPTLSRKINDLLDENKENIDNSSRKFHPTNEADGAAASLTKKSLRQLKNMVKEKTPGAEVPIDMASSTLAADPLPQQMSSSLLQLGSNSETVICPASVTPTMKSASKAPTLSRKINDLLDENKENIDNSSRKFHPTNEADGAAASLTKKSLRQLKNMVKEKTPGAEVPIDMASSTLAADPLPQQMSSSLLQLGSNSETVICPASVTPTMKSASKAPTLSRKINDLLDENKENINSSRKFHPTNEADDAAASLTKKSLRQLKNMVKEKMQVTNKKNIHEEKDTAKVGRPALQSLSENRLVASEPGNV